MKQVLIKPPVSAYITPDQLSDESFYGVKQPYNNNYGFISNRATDRRKQMWWHQHGVNDQIFDNIRVTVKYLLENGCEVFEFPTQKELFQWLGKNI